MDPRRQPSIVSCDSSNSSKRSPPSSSASGSISKFSAQPSTPSAPSSRRSGGSRPALPVRTNGPIPVMPASLWRRLARVVGALMTLATQRPHEAGVVVASLERLLRELD